MSAVPKNNAAFGDIMIHVVDDDPATRDAMRTLFNSVSLPNRVYKTAEQFVESLPLDQPGCLVLDLRMPGMSGLELQRVLREQRCRIPIIFLTGHGNVGTAVRAMHGGAVDFLTKPVDDEALIEKVQDAIRRDQANVQHRAERDQARERMETLTPRELQVLEGVVAGLSNKQMARELDISYKTVELHRAHMMRKLQAQSIAEVVRMHYAVAGNDATALEEQA